MKPGIRRILGTVAAADSRTLTTQPFGAAAGIFQGIHAATDLLQGHAASLHKSLRKSSTSTPSCPNPPRQLSTSVSSGKPLPMSDSGSTAGSDRGIRTPGSERSSRAPSVLFQLCNKCDEVFQLERRANPEEVDLITNLLGSIPLQELGLGAPRVSASKSDTEEGAPQWAPPITYLHIHACNEYTVGIFCLPKHATIPLHNHPGMTVFSRVLYGDMRVKSFDMATGEAAALSGSGKAAVIPVRDVVKTGEDIPSVIFPDSGGNIHSFTAITDCAVLDVLSPPYSSDHGRDCTYFREVGGQGQEPVLEVYEPPMDFVVLQGTYTGLDVSKRHLAPSRESSRSRLSVDAAHNGAEEQLQELKISDELLC